MCACEIFRKELIYCGLHISGNGIAVDPARLTGLIEASPPRTVGDVWQFKAAVGIVTQDYFSNIYFYLECFSKVFLE